MLIAKLLEAVKTAVEPEQAIVPATGVAPGPVTVKVDRVTVAQLIAWLKIAETGG